MIGPIVQASGLEAPAGSAFATASSPQAASKAKAARAAERTCMVRIVGVSPISPHNLPSWQGGESASPLLGLAEHLVGGLDRLEALRGLRIAGGGVGMVGLREAAVGGLDRLEGGVGVVYLEG